MLRTTHTLLLLLLLWTSPLHLIPSPPWTSLSFLTHSPFPLSHTCRHGLFRLPREARLPRGPPPTHQEQGRRAAQGDQGGLHQVVSGGREVGRALIQTPRSSLFPLVDSSPFHRVFSILSFSAAQVPDEVRGRRPQQGLPGIETPPHILLRRL